MKNRQIVYGALLSYGTIALHILTGLLYTPWMIRTLGGDQYALYTLAISVINMFLLDFGIGSAVSKFLTEYYAGGQYEEANRLMAIVYKAFAIISAGIALCLLVFSCFIDSIYGNLTAGELRVFKPLFLIAAVCSAGAFPFTAFQGVLMANEQFIAVKACNFGQKLLNVGLTAAALLTGQRIYALVLANAISNVVFIGIRYFCIRHRTALKVNISYWDPTMAKGLFTFSAWVTVGNLAGRFVLGIMPTILAALSGTAEVTLFSLASTLEGYVFTLSEAVNGMFLPKISRMLARGQNGGELSALMNRVGRYHVATLGLLYLGFVCLGREFVTLWMGNDYDSVYFCALLLIFPSLVDVPQQIARTALTATNVVKEQALIYLGMAMVNVMLSWVLVQRIGAAGAAASVCCAYLFRTAAFNMLYARKLPVDLAAYFKAAYGRWGCAALLTLAGGMVVNGVIQTGGWAGLLQKIAAVTVIYLLLFWKIGLAPEEREYFAKQLHCGKESL